MHICMVNITILCTNHDCTLVPAWTIQNTCIIKKANNAPIANHFSRHLFKVMTIWVKYYI